MDTFVNAHITGLDELVALWQTAPQLTEREMYRGMQESTLLAEHNIKEQTPVGAGGAAGLVGSIAGSAPQKVANGLVGFVGTSLNYAVPVELGTKPHFPPLLPIQEWVEAVLGITGQRARSVAFLIARKISRKGTKGQFMFKKGTENSEDQLQDIFDKTVLRIRGALLP